MKTLFFKIFTLNLLLFAFIVAKADSPANLIDTSLTIQSVLPESVLSPTIVLKKANVVYPEILSGHETQSISYVEKFSANRKKYLTVLYNRGKEFFPAVKTIFDQYSVPEEFKVLMAIESGFNGNAVSPAGAVGYWQFMGASAREYGLKVRMKIRNINYKYSSKKYHSKKYAYRNRKYIYLDERKDFFKSTHAAAQYLRDRCRELNNDWLLVAASYNCGVGNVRKAIKKSGIDCASFWDVQQFLPLETRNYVMNFITLNVIFKNYDNFEQGNLCFKDIICKPVQNDNKLCEEDMSTCMADVPKL